MGSETQPPPGARPATAASDAAPFEDWPTPAGPASDLPPIAAKADDLEAIKAAVDNAASVGGGLWLSYLFVLFYLAVAAGAVTHVDLFLEKPVKLPFLNVELPLWWFFLVAPFLFLVVHAYTLVHLAMLSDKAKWFHRELYRQIRIPGDQRDQLPRNRFVQLLTKAYTLMRAAIRGSKVNPLGEALPPPEEPRQPEKARRQKIRADLRRQLPSNIFVQLLAGPSDLREKGFGLLLRGIASVTLVVAPMLLLLLIQIQFLPYHDRFITWVHRGVLLVDIGLVWWLWGKILSGHAVGDRRRPSSASRAIGSVFGLLVAVFSVMVVTFPGEWQEDFLAKWDPSKWIVRPHDWLFNGPVDEVTRRRVSLFSNTLVLPGFNIYEGLGIDDPDKAKWHDFLFRARGRNLRGAIFDLATLRKVDFEGANLRGASLNLAQLQGSSLENADLQGAFLDVAKLQGASLDLARLQGASLRDAILQGASLTRAGLQGAEMFHAQLQGASLQGAQLQSADLGFAQLQGAWLFGAELQASALEAAQLEGATLDAANLEGARLDYANLQGASLQQARLRATSLSMAFLWRTNRDDADRIPGAPRSTAPSNVIPPSAPDRWLPIWRDGQGNLHPWGDAAYQELRHMIEAFAGGVPRDQALESIRRVDCANPNPSLTSCDSSIPPPEAAERWRKAVEDARVDDLAYTKALSEVLRSLVCSGDENAIYILRGLESPLNSRFADIGSGAPALVGFVMSKDCPVSVALTDADRARLLQIKQASEKAELRGRPRN